MPDLHSRIASELSRRLEVAKAATPGPWEVGDCWWRAGVMPKLFGEGKCNFCQRHGEPVAVAEMDINGRMMLGHVHRAAETDSPSISNGAPFWGTVIHGRDEHGPNVSIQDAAFIAEHDPADAQRRYSSALRVLERHRDCQHGGLHGHDTVPWCDICWTPHPCPDVVDLCASLGLDTEGSTTDGV